MVDTGNLLWKLISPNVWQRGLDEVELYWAKVAKLHDSQGRRPFEVTGHVSLIAEKLGVSTKDAAEKFDSALRKAWLTARHFHPTIASWTTVDATHQFKTYGGIRAEGEIEEWLEKTLVKVSGYRSGVEFANSDPLAPELPTLFIISCPSTTAVDGVGAIRRDLVLRASHAVIDGAGTLLFLGNLLRYVAEALDKGSSYVAPALDGSEAANLSPPYRIAAEIPETPTLDIKQRIEKMGSEHVHFGASSGSGDLAPLPLPFKKGSLVPGKNQRVEIILDKSTVTKLLDACKSVGATVTHILHAAVPLAIRDLVKRQPEEARYNYVFDLLYNLRDFCKQPYNTAAHAVAAYHSGSTKGCRVEVVVQAARSEAPSGEARKNEFSRVLSEVREFYKYVRSDTEQGQLAPYCWAGHLEGLPGIPETPTPGPPPGETASVTISSLGRVDGIIPPRVGDIQVSNPWVTGEEMSNSIGLFIVTHDGTLSLAAAYNDAWHEKDEVLKFIARCKALVFEFLGLEDTHDTSQPPI